MYIIEFNGAIELHVTLNIYMNMNYTYISIPLNIYVNMHFIMFQMSGQFCIVKFLIDDTVDIVPTSWLENSEDVSNKTP